MELKFRNSNLARYNIIEYQGRKYIMDLHSMKGKCYYAGLLPKEISVQMTEVSLDDVSFERKGTPKFSTGLIVAVVQPFVKLLYDMMERTFIRYNIEQQMVIKTSLFLLPLIISYLVVQYYLFSSGRIAEQRLQNYTKKMQVSFTPNGKRMFGWQLLILINLVIFGFYMFLNISGAGTFLVINGIVTTLMLLIFIAMSPVSTPYRNGELLLINISEVGA